MILACSQTVLLMAAGVVLFRVWRATVPAQRWLRIVVAAGFLTRAIAGQALFWISWARLPIARSMQPGDGLWFFALDAQTYFTNAVAGATGGLWAIITFNRAVPSVMYVKTLAIAVWLFGRVTSVALLINLFCYLGAIWIIVAWSRREPRARAAAAVAITAISVSPAFLLWSLQPLKDSFFQFLYVAFIACCAEWQRASLATRRPPKRIGTGAILIVLFFALAGTRWYFAVALLGAVTIFVFLTAFRTPARRLAAVAVALIVMLVLSQALVGGAGPWLPEPIAAALTPRTFVEAMKKLPASLLETVESNRSALDSAGGATVIRVGKRLQPSGPQPLPVSTSASRITRLLTGIVAIFLPRSVGEWLGLIEIGGGRGMLWFTDIDTLIFDVALLFAAWLLMAGFRVAYRDPLTWLILMLTLMVGVPLAYSVSNFGTLFRYRDIVYLGCLLAPLAVASASPAASADPPGVDIAVGESQAVAPS
jgi:hypothetical protein